MEIRVTTDDGHRVLANAASDEPLVVEAACINGDHQWKLTIEIAEWNGLPRITAVQADDYVRV